MGYRTTRQYMRCDDPNGPRTRWVQEIVRGEGDDEGKPLFRLTADEGLHEPIVAKSATAAWAEVLRRVTTVRRANGEEAKKTAISGPEFFGYSAPPHPPSHRGTSRGERLHRIQASAGAKRDCRSIRIRGGGAGRRRSSRRRDKTPGGEQQTTLSR